jgi:hypothetical protein
VRHGCGAAARPAAAPAARERDGVRSAGGAARLSHDHFPEASPLTAESVSSSLSASDSFRCAVGRG